MSHPTLEEKLAALKVSAPSAYERACADSLRPGDYEIGVQRTADILDEGYEIFMRSSRSSMGVAGDSIVAIFNAAGDLVNASAGTYLHAVIPPIVIKYILSRHSKNPGINDGDIWYTNDALYGGIHNPDQVAIMPVFFEGELVAWTAALSHTTETGAVEPGGMPLAATARFQEGMNLPPMRVGTDFQINTDVLEMFAAFGIRAEANVTVDMRARATTADRVRVRLLEMIAREGKDFVVGLMRRMLDEAEAGARKRIAHWPDGTYRTVTFSDAAGLAPGLIRNCAMTMIKKGDHLLFDFTGTSPETPSSYNAHPQAVIGHMANYIYEYVFHDLPVSSATFEPIDFVFPPNSILSPDARAATSCSVMAATGAMSAVANCISRARFGSDEWKQVAASQGNGGNAIVLAGVSQWGANFADMIAYPINTEGQGARATSDGMDAYGFPWCAFGRAPDVESMENEFPMLIPFSSHWKDSGGHGKHRGGVGTAQLWVTHHVPMLFQMAIADNSVIQTPQPLFGGYAPPTVPGIRLDGIDVAEAMASAKTGTLTLEALLRGEFGGTVVSGPYGSAVHPVPGGQSIIVGLSTGGTGYGDPLARDPASVAADVTKNLVSVHVARDIYGVAIDPVSGRVDDEATRASRESMIAARLERGRPYEEFEADWSQRKPPEEILEFFGSWPDGSVVTPLIRM
ncbi:hydantoinase B/oxoprolinase family protein [Sphaerisporangium perillae]|uniref:hydantoinase B/oxoprolinase family protein n=1 Tax=Sphaerisporangium perillae TaxID=2935860 RepID=UPI00200F6456|nr:hydantoinase B/oxoprolinase family protein [Sphaerisporangium perillae]